MIDEEKRGRKKKTPYSDLIILYFLYNGESHCGYTMKKLIADSKISEWISISSMTVYQSMRRLANLGYIKGATEKLSAYPERIMYEISDKGKVYFDGFLMEELENYSKEFFHIDIGVGLSKYMDEKDTIKALKNRVKQLNARLLQVEVMLDHLPDKKNELFKQKALLDHEQSYLKFEIGWLRKYIREHK